MHGIAAITGNMHRSLRYFVLLERITSNNNSGKRAKRAELTYISFRAYFFVRSRNCFCSCVGVCVHIFSYALARAG